MSELVRASEPCSPLGDRRSWARDFALVTSAPTLVVAASGGVSVAMLFATLVAAALGATIGAAMPSILVRYVRFVPWIVLVLAAAGLGANVGGTVALVRSLDPSAPNGALHGIASGAAIGWILGALFVVPYAILRARKVSVAPLRMAMLVLTPLAIAAGSFYARWS